MAIHSKLRFAAAVCLLSSPRLAAGSDAGRFLAATGTTDVVVPDPLVPVVPPPVAEPSLQNLDETAPLKDAAEGSPAPKATQPVEDTQAHEVDEVGELGVGTDHAKGGFSFEPESPPPSALEVKIPKASLADFFQELLNGQIVPGEIEIVKEEVGAVKSGHLTDLTVTKALLGGGVHLIPGADKGVLAVEIPKLTAAMTSKYSVKLTDLQVPETGYMNLTLEDAKVDLALPMSGAAEGSCKFGDATRLHIKSTSPLDSAGGDAVDEALKSFVAAVNQNLLSLQSGVQHAVEKGLCAALLAKYGEANEAEFDTLAKESKGEEEEWKAQLAKIGVTPLEAAVGGGLLVFGWLLGIICVAGPRCCCGRRRSKGLESLPLKHTGMEGEAVYGYADRGNKSLLASLSCCRRARTGAYRDDGM